MKKRIPLALVLIAFIAALSVAQSGQTANSQTPSSHTMITPESLKWNALSAGQSVSVLSGSPNTEGSPFVLRIKLDNGVKVAPHWHPTDEHLTVVSGTFYMGMGEKFNEAAAKEMPAGSYVLMPKEMRHFAWVKGETIVQLHGIGPFKTYWVDSVEERDKK